MEKYIEILADATAADGGRAVVRLHGVWLLPPQATLQIEPIEGEPFDEGAEGWPTGAHAPLATKVTSYGIEMIVGPQIVDAPALVPGTPVRVVVSAVPLEQELLWPEIPVSQGQRITTLLASADELVRHERERAAMQRAEEPTLAPEPMKEDAPGTSNASPVFAEAASALAAEAADRDVTGTVGSPFDRTGADARGRDGTTAILMPDAAGPSRLPGTAVDADGGSKRVLPGLFRSPLGVFVAGAASALLLAAVAVLAVLGPQAAGARGGTDAKLVALLADIVAVGDVSPRGRSSAGLDQAAMLNLADFSLRGTRGSVDHEEARYWLRRSLRDALHGEPVQWALTQLGASFANVPSEAADAVKARALWEVAGRLGDPVANCFLATAYEQGAGVGRDHSAAERHREAARSRGGCRDRNAALVPQMKPQIKE